MVFVLIFLLKCFLVIIAADFVAGLVHWWEDAYIREKTPLIGKLVGTNNMVHHYYPRYFTKFGWWTSSWDLVVLGSILLLIAWYFKFLSWPLVAFVILASNANQIHKFSHRTKSENGRIINFLQKYKIILTPKHHAVHHTNPKNIYYCPITNMLNPILNFVDFWTKLEWVVFKVFGMERKPDLSVTNKVAPEWVKAFIEK